jgi:hypothetical protein
MTTSASALDALPRQRRSGLMGPLLPITLFSIPLGLAGLGAAWTAVADVLAAPELPGHLAFAAAAAIWVLFTLAYALGTMRNASGSFHLDLRHPLTGPLTAYIPVIAMLLIPHYATGLGAAGRVLTYVALAAMTPTPPHSSPTGSRRRSPRTRSTRATTYRSPPARSSPASAWQA